MITPYTWADALARAVRSQYDNDMSNPPVVLQGSAEAISPTRIAAPTANPAHKFFNVIRDIVHMSGYHTEGQLLEALNAISAYEKQLVTASDLRQVSTDNDRAAVEDVTQRKAPNAVGPQPLQTAAPIDYNQLAAALLAAQAAQSQGVVNQ